MRRRIRSVLAVTVMTALCMAGVGVTPAGAKKQSFCGYVRSHRFEFTEVFSSDTSPTIAAASSDQEIKRLVKRAPKVLQADFKTFRELLAAIRTGDSAAISAVAGAAGAASQRILDYVATKCGVTVGVPTT